MSLTPPPTAPARTQDKTTFNTNVDLFLAWFATMVSETNTLQASLSAIAAGGAMCIPYTFSTTTTDADPGAGFMRLDNATQNTATTIRLDLVGADGSTWTSVIDTFDDSTSGIKGHILIQKVSDATKWLLFSVSSLASPSGYKNITVTNVSGSAASPFSNGDSVVVKFSRNGDSGTPSTPNSAVVVTTGNGWGSTNTKIRRYTTTLVNVGSDITYADSATLGASLTINTTGLYFISAADAASGGAISMGASVNSAQLTTSVLTITAANRLFAGSVQNVGVETSPIGSGLFYLTAGDVVRPHGGGANHRDSDVTTQFLIRKL